MTPVYYLHSLVPGSIIPGPAIINDATQTLVVVPESRAKILPHHVILEMTSTARQDISDKIVDPAALSVFGHRFMSIAEQMGRALQNTSVSLNIKERLDFSCAIFGPDGRWIPLVSLTKANKPQLVLLQTPLTCPSISDQ